MQSIKYILFIILIVIIGLFVFSRTPVKDKVIVSGVADPSMYFKSRKMQKFCIALIKNDFQTTDKLLEKGLEINTIGDKAKNKRENEYAPTPLVWLFLGNAENPKKLKAFEYLLKKGADPMIPYDKYESTLLFETAGYVYPDYLKLILKYGRLQRNDLNKALKDTGTLNSPLLHAMATERFENFKLLLDAGADMNWIDINGESTLLEAVISGSWKFAYELLKRGVNYERDLKDIKRFIELESSPVTAINFRGVDYRQKIVQWFRKRGVEMKPGTAKDKKYIFENGKDVLYVNDGIDHETGKRIPGKEDKWIKFEESSRYEGTTKDPDTQKYLDPEIEKMKIEKIK